MGRIWSNGSGLALNAANLNSLENDVAASPKPWKANTSYAAGQAALDPNGNLVTANAAFTSGTTYNSANWTAPADRSYAPLYPSSLEKWFAGGIRGKKIVLVGDSTTDYAYGLNRALQNYYTRRGRELEGVSVLNYGVNGQTLATWQADNSGRYGVAGTVAQNADLYVFSYGINDVRTGATSEDTLYSMICSAVDSLRANGTSTVLLRVPLTFTTTDTGSLGFVSPTTSAQAYSTLLRNAYIRAAVTKKCALLDTQALVSGLTSNPDTQSPFMLNQIHPNDAGNFAIARELVKMIGVPASQAPAVVYMPGRVGVGTIGSRSFPSGGRVALGMANYRPTVTSGTVTVELRRMPANTVIGTATYTGGYSSTNVFAPAASTVDWTTLSAGDSIQVAVTAASAPVNDLSVYLLTDEAPTARAYPLQLRGAGLVSPLDGSVVYSATQGLPTTSERTIGSLKAVGFKRLNANRFTKWSQDATQTSVWTVSNATVSGSPGNQTLTATTTGSIAFATAPVTAGETLTFSWKATTSGSPKYAVYDQTNSAFVVTSTAWPAADGNGWRSVTFTVPTGCTTIRCYPLAASAAVGDTVTLTGMQLTSGSSMGTYAPTNAIGTSMVVNTGALPSDFTLIRLVKTDASVGSGAVSVVGPAGNTDGNPALQAPSGANQFGFPVITTRGTVAMGASGAWSISVLRATGGNVYVSLNDQAASSAFAKAVNATDIRVNLLSASDTTGSYQNWDGEVILEYFPYLLSEGDATARVRELVRTLLAAGETVTGDWPAQKLS